MPKAPTPQFITVKQAADTFACSERTIYRWLDAGKITRYHQGARFLRVDLEEIKQMLTQGAR